MTKDSRKWRAAFALVNAARRAGANRRRIRQVERQTEAERELWLEQQFWDPAEVAAQNAGLAKPQPKPAAAPVESATDPPPAASPPA